MLYGPIASLLRLVGFKINFKNIVKLPKFPPFVMLYGPIASLLRLVGDALKPTRIRRVNPNHQRDEQNSAARGIKT
ncbi:hypothetical protein L1887_02590 [Cichorium endivia]|nr:hypothetical protein L1887_02590 [Cichorium endivia]